MTTTQGIRIYTGPTCRDCNRPADWYTYDNRDDQGIHDDRKCREHAKTWIEQDQVHHQAERV